MLDNASGSATILDIAQQLKNTNTRNKLRFIWFGGEELGLLGSDYYVNTLPPDELGEDQVRPRRRRHGHAELRRGRPRPETGSTCSADGPGTPMPPSIWAPSAIARDYGIDYLNSIGKNHILFSADGTDAFMFQLAGIPASGVLTGQDCCKLASDVALFGGFEGNFEGTVPERRRGLRGQPVPLVRQPQQQRPRGADLDVEDLRQHGRTHGLRHPGLPAQAEGFGARWRGGLESRSQPRRSVGSIRAALGVGCGPRPVASASRAPGRRTSGCSRWRGRCTRRQAGSGRSAGACRRPGSPCRRRAP